jgi:hypothetical protein
MCVVQYFLNLRFFVSCLINLHPHSKHTRRRWDFFVLHVRFTMTFIHECLPSFFILRLTVSPTHVKNFKHRFDNVKYLCCWLLAIRNLPGRSGQEPCECECTDNDARVKAQTLTRQTETRHTFRSFITSVVTAKFYLVSDSRFFVFLLLFRNVMFALRR